MRKLKPGEAASNTTAAHPGRPAVSILHDGDDARVVIFRISEGQEVAVHRSGSTVLLSVLEGEGEFTGADAVQAATVGDLAIYDPQEPHGMRSTGGTFVVMATIAPRPGSR